jgi:hypothetical protein
MSEDELCSAVPETLLDLSDNGLGQVGIWRQKLAELDETLSALRRALRREIPRDIRPDVPDADTTFPNLVDRQEHLDEWVGEVGWDFIRADGSEHLYVGRGSTEMQDAYYYASLSDERSQVVTVSAGEISVGFADAGREEIRQEGIRFAEEELRDQLVANGLDPDDFSPDDLLAMDPEDGAYLELWAELQALQHNLNGEDGDAFAAGLFTGLGENGTRATLGAIEMYELHQFSPPRDGPHAHNSLEVPILDGAPQLLADFTTGFAAATPHLPREMTDGLIDTGDDPWRQHQLGLLLSADGEHYDPEFLAAAADQVLVSNPENTQFMRDLHADGQVGYYHGYPPMNVRADDLWGDPMLAYPQAQAFQALGGNSEASWIFANSSDEALEVILAPGTGLPYGVVHSRGTPASPVLHGGTYNHELMDFIDDQAGLVTTNVFVTAPADDPSRQGPPLGHVDGLDTNAEPDLHGNTQLFWDAIPIVARGDSPEQVREALGEAMDEHDLVYVDTLFTYASRHAPSEANLPYQHTGHDFLVEIISPDETGPQAQAAIDLWTTRELDAWFERNDSMEPEGGNYEQQSGPGAEMTHIGRMTQLSAIAEYNVTMGDADRYDERLRRRQAAVDAALGLTPTGSGPIGTATSAVNTVNSLAGAANNTSDANLPTVGSLVFRDDGTGDRLRDEAANDLAYSVLHNDHMLVDAAYRADRLDDTSAQEELSVLEDDNGRLRTLDNMSEEEIQLYMNVVYSPAVLGDISISRDGPISGEYRAYTSAIPYDEAIPLGDSRYPHPGQPE